MAKRTQIYIALMLVLPLLCGCAGLAALPQATPAGSEADDPVTQLELCGSGMTDADLAALYEKTALVQLDLRNNALSVEAVSALSAALPACQILWSIPLGTERFDSDSAEIILPPGAAADELDNLRLFPNLNRVDASASTDYEALKEIAAALPDCEIVWTIDLFGQSYPSATTTLDLTDAAILDDAALVQALSPFPRLDSVDLAGKTLSFSAMDALAEAYPDTAFLWSFDFYGVAVSSDMTKVDISDRAVDDLEAFGQTLHYLPNLAEIDMCNCGPTNEEMETLIEAFPNVKFVWMIRLGGWEMRTDVKAFSKGNYDVFEGGRYVGDGKTNFHSEDLEPLKYCTDLIALDLGHGNRLTDISILQYLPKLRFLIVAMNRIESIEPLKYCPDLEFLEIFQNSISDWSPLLSLKKLTHLNCGANYAKDENGERIYPDYTILKQMPQLERLWVIRSGLTGKQLSDLKAALPNTVINTIGEHSTSNGWRANPLYPEMQALFNLPVQD